MHAAGLTVDVTDTRKTKSTLTGLIVDSTKRQKNKVNEEVEDNLTKETRRLNRGCHWYTENDE